MKRLDSLYQSYMTMIIVQKGVSELLYPDWIVELSLKASHI